MYANRPWTIRQYAGFSTAEESNAFYRQNLAAGQMGLSVAFDLATHRGYDSDHPRVVGDVGKAGVAIDSVEDMKILFDGIPLDKMSVSMTMNGAVLPVLAGYVVAARRTGREPGQAHAGRSRTTSSKSSWSATPTSIRPRRACGSSATSSSTRRSTCRGSTRSRSPATTCKKRARPRCRSSASRSPTASSTRASRASRGLSSTSSPGRLSFFFAIGMNFFMEVAKLRAARLLWARIMTDLEREEARFEDAAHALPDVGRVAHRAGPVQQHRAHRVRGARGGARRHAEPAHERFDEAIALPSDFAARIARNTQLILAEETGVTHVVDPLGGSYYVEALTQSLAERGVDADPGGRGSSAA